MRLLHTADWHLGHTLRDVSREPEHRAFLQWLLGTLASERVDALIIAGDVFHTANPSAAAQALWYDFLADARARLPTLDVVVVGGNHDSAARLDAPGRLLGLDRVRIHVVGGAPRDADGGLAYDRMAVALTDGPGNVRAVVAAVPFLRSTDLPAVDGGDPIVDGVRAVYAGAVAAARRLRMPGSGAAVIATGHGLLAGARMSPDSERKVHGGNQHPIPPDVFPPDVAYVALGHLHLAQAVGAEHIRYSGSPLPLSMGEVSYPHQVVVVDVEGPRFVRARPIAVPRFVDLVRLPAEGHAPIDDALALLRALPESGPGQPPWLEVRVKVERAEPLLRRRIEEALVGRHARLVHIDVARPEQGAPLGEVAARPLGDLTPEEVFLRRFQRARGDGAEVPPALWAAFHELLGDAAREAVA